jgi:hypothetical protein
LRYAYELVCQALGTRVMRRKGAATLTMPDCGQGDRDTLSGCCEDKYLVDETKLHDVGVEKV